MQRSDNARLTDRFFEVELGVIPTRLLPWVSYAVVNRATSIGKRSVFSRPPEATVHVGFISGLKSGSAGRVPSEPQRLLIGGPQRRLYRVPFPADEALLVALSPAGVRGLLGVPLQALADQIIDAEELWGDPARRAFEQLSLASSTQQRFSSLFGLIESRVQRAPDPFPQQLIARLGTHIFGSKVSTLAAELGYSERQLRRKSLDQLGLAPKELSQMLRIRSVLRNAVSPIDWARCAAEFGYCDQAHLIHEFQEFVGASPKSFIGTLTDPRLLGGDVAVQPG